MERTIILLGGGRELALPVTPSSFSVGEGISIDTVDIYQLGQVDLAGRPVLQTIRLDCMLPARDYPFASGDGQPYSIVGTLESWCRSGKVIRLVVTDTTVNLPCRIESVTYGERDGTNDVYASITLRTHRSVEAAAQSRGAADNKPRTKESPARSQDQSYRIRQGDTLSAICRQYYGDGSAKYYNALAAYNGIANPHLIYTGDSLKIPDEGRLGL